MSPSCVLFSAQPDVKARHVETLCLLVSMGLMTVDELQRFLSLPQMTTQTSLSTGRTSDMLFGGMLEPVMVPFDLYYVDTQGTLLSYAGLLDYPCANDYGCPESARTCDEQAVSQLLYGTPWASVSLTPMRLENRVDVWRHGYLVARLFKARQVNDSAQPGEKLCSRCKSKGVFRRTALVCPNHTDEILGGF